MTVIRIYFHCFSEKIKFDVSSESSARQMMHMKNQAVFSSKDKSKKLKCRLLQFLFGASKVNICRLIFSRCLTISDSNRAKQDSIPDFLTISVQKRVCLKK